MIAPSVLTLIEVAQECMAFVYGSVATNTWLYQQKKNFEGSPSRCAAPTIVSLQLRCARQHSSMFRPFRRPLDLAIHNCSDVCNTHQASQDAIRDGR